MIRRADPCRKVVDHGDRENAQGRDDRADGSSAAEGYRIKINQPRFPLRGKGPGAGLYAENMASLAVEDRK